MYHETLVDQDGFALVKKFLVFLLLPEIYFCYMSLFLVQVVKRPVFDIRA
jgi:membrane-anchored glycerophosphoryl diester phosphodiesterase (GDPDase)